MRKTKINLRIERINVPSLLLYLKTYKVQFTTYNEFSSSYSGLNKVFA